MLVDKQASVVNGPELPVVPFADTFDGGEGEKAEPGGTFHENQELAFLLREVYRLYKL